MEFIEVEKQLREVLLPVFGLDEIEELKPEYSLVEHLEAESLDFVEIMWLIEECFGVVLKPNEIISGSHDQQSLFVENRLTAAGAQLLQQQFPHSATKIQPGLSKVDMFRMMTIRDLAARVQTKLAEGQPC